MSATLMQFGNGAMVDIACIGKDGIDIRSAAVSLSRLPRFGGHLVRPFTVGQHSLVCVQLATEIMGDQWESLRLTPREQLLVQLRVATHDFHESVTGDIPSPVKRLLGAPYENITTAYDTALEFALGLQGADRLFWSGTSCDVVLRQADRMSMHLEDRYFGRGTRFSDDEVAASLRHADKHDSRSSLYEYFWSMSQGNVADRLVWLVGSLQEKLK